MTTYMQYNYTDFNIENHDITFEGNNDNDVLISIPFTDDTPNCIKEKLNELISRCMNEWAKLGTWNGILKQAHMPMPKDLLLNASLQLHYEYKSGMRYYIAITITGLELDVYDIWIDKDILISSSSELYNEFVTFCKDKLNGLLFPIS